jgi:hypothetical protein
MAAQAISHAPQAQHVQQSKPAPRAESAPKPAETKPANTGNKIDIKV